jgi:hypothetical protein
MFSLSMVRRSFSGLIVITVMSLSLTAPVLAQDQQNQQTAQDRETAAPPIMSERPFSFWSLTKDVALDPTTYAPSVLSYTSTRLDWDTSQVFFRNGYVEDNPRYTATGLAHDTPMGYNAGNRKILGDTMTILGGSLAHNYTERLFERYLMEKYPDHRKLVRTIGWIERIGFSSYWSYRLSAAHFRQWQANDRLASQLGLH